MLFIDDDEARSQQRREDGRSRADHQRHFPAADAMPLVVPLAVGEAAVLNRHARAESRTEYGRDCRRERDFRHQHQHAATGAHRMIGEPQVDLGLTAPGHAVQQRHLEPFGGGERVEPLNRGRLLVGEGPLVRRGIAVAACAVENGSRSTRCWRTSTRRMASSLFTTEADTPRSANAGVVAPSGNVRRRSSASRCRVPRAIGVSSGEQRGPIARRSATARPSSLNTATRVVRNASRAT